MTLVLPYPNTPLNGQPGDPVPINANFTAITQAIQDFDGSQIAAGTITESALATNIDPVTRGNETIANFIYIGCIWSSVSGLSGTMTGGTLYVQGNRIVSPGVVSHTFTASKDTYIDIDKLGNVTYVAVANGATSGMTLTVNSVRVALVVTGSSTISSVTQFGADPIGNIIYPNGPSSTAKLQNPFKFSVYRNSAWTTGSNAFAKLQFDSKTFDNGNNYDATTNYRATATEAGDYWFDACAAWTGASVSSVIEFYVNGVATKYGTLITTGANKNAAFLRLNIGDYVEAWLFTASSETGTTGSLSTYFSGFMISGS